MEKRIVRYALFAVVCAAGTAWACARGNASPPEGTSPARGVLTLSGRVIDDAYIGNGVQWDPYEVHDVDGRFSAADRKRLTDRLEYMQPRFIRVMGGIRSYLTDGRFDPSRNMEDLHMILGFCNTHGVTVLLGDWGGSLVDRQAQTVDQALIDSSGEMVRYLVEECGYDCIRYYNIVNEPNGSWASTRGDYALWLRAARAMDASLRRHGMAGRVKLVAPDAAVWTTLETHWVSNSVRDLGDAVGLYDIHTYPSKAQVNTGEYSAMISAYRAAAPAGTKMILGELGLKFIDERDVAYAAENERRIAADPDASPGDSQMFVFDHMYGIDVADAVMQTAACGYSGCVVWMLDDAMHMNEPGKLKIWGFWNILGEERYGAGKERIRPWYYAMSLLCRYFPQGAQILASGVSGVGGVRSMFGRTEKGVTLAVVNTDSERTVELTLENPQPGLSDLALYVYAPGAAQARGRTVASRQARGGACVRKPDRPDPRDDARLHLDGMTGHFHALSRTEKRIPLPRRKRDSASQDEGLLFRFLAYVEDVTVVRFVFLVMGDLVFLHFGQQECLFTVPVLLQESRDACACMGEVVFRPAMLRQCEMCQRCISGLFEDPHFPRRAVDVGEIVRDEFRRQACA